MNADFSRRRLLWRGAAAGVGYWLTGLEGQAAAPPSASPNERVNVAIVGSGGRGEENLKEIADEKAEVNIVALCDVDQARLDAAGQRNPRARRFRDFRKMFDMMGAQFEAVVVSTPDHMHAPVSLAAIRRGKHVYCEKPLCWCIAEARRLAESARKYKVATQMGTQGMAESGSRAGVEMVRSGVLGPVREMHVWTDRAKGWWPQGVDRPPATPPVPTSLDWDLWLGVAKPRPYHPDYVPFRWRGWKEFGTGPLGDMGIHNAAMPYIGLRLGLPTAVEITEVSDHHAESFPAWAILKYEFPARGDMPPLVMHWYDGGKKPAAELFSGWKGKVAENGALLIGDKGSLYSIEWTGGDWRLLPTDKFRGHKRPAPTEPRSPGHHAEWVRACKGGPPAYCNFIDFASRITEVMLLGGLALRVGKRIEWDATAMRTRNCPEADALIDRAYRPGWETLH
jgi:predicted dehydrogenase